MTGSSIFEYIHENDHCEFSEQLGLSVTTNNNSSNNTTTNSGMTSPSSFNEETTGNGLFVSLWIYAVDDTLDRFQLTFELIESLYNLISHATISMIFLTLFFSVIISRIIDDAQWK